MSFAHPWVLVLGLLFVPMVALYFSSRGRSFVFPSRSPLYNLRTPGIWLRHVPFWMRLGALACLLLAMARPQISDTKVKRTTEGLDIVMVVDTSGSMEARDFVVDGKRPTRLTVVKKVIEDFIKARPSDRIGMVVFGTEAFTQAPLTLDHDVLMRFLSHVKISMAGNATAIGDGLATAVKRLKDIEAKSRIVILLTDGSNSAGRVDPLMAAEAAATLDVKVYTIGVGSDGTVPVVRAGRVYQQKVEIDEGLLKQIAETTGGQYYRARDTQSLVKIYETIDKLEKTKINVQSFTNFKDLYAWFVWPAVGFVFFELLFGLSRYRTVP